MKLLLPLLFSTLIPAQAIAFGGPQYGYNSTGQLVDFTAIPYGAATPGTTVFYTSQNHGAFIVFLLEGASLTVTPMLFNATLYVDDIVNIVPAVLTPSFATWVADRAIPNDPSLIGGVYFAQFAHLFSAHYGLSYGIQVTIQ